MADIEPIKTDDPSVWLAHNGVECPRLHIRMSRTACEEHQNRRAHMWRTGNSGGEYAKHSVHPSFLACLGCPEFKLDRTKFMKGKKEALIPEY